MHVEPAEMLSQILLAFISSVDLLKRVMSSHKPSGGWGGEASAIPPGCESVTSCHRVVPRRCDLWVLRGVARLLVGGSILYPVNPTPTSSSITRGKQRSGLTWTPAVCAGADFAPSCFSDPFLFPLGFNLSKSWAESESAPAAAATACRRGHCWVVKKAIDLPLDGICIQFLN